MRSGAAKKTLPRGKQGLNGHNHIASPSNLGKVAPEIGGILMKFTRMRLMAAVAASTLVLAACGGGSAEEVPNPAEESAIPAPDYTAMMASAEWAHDASDLKPDPSVIYGHLENGMGYVLMENDTPSGTAAIRLHVDAGSTSEADDQSGLSHFLEHMAFNGSTNVPEGEMIKILERYGLAFGPDTNAFTSFDQVQYQLDLPSVEEEVIDTGIFIMRETAGNLLLDSGAIDRERGVIKSEERTRDTYGLRNLVNQLEFLAPDTILADRLPIGDLNVIATAPRERFVDIYNKYYRPERVTFVMVGDFDAAEIEAKLSDKFGDWEGVGEEGGDPNLGDISTDRGLQANFFYDPDVPTTISLNYVVPYEQEADTAEARKDDLILSIGNGIVSRRLTKLARLEDAPFLGGRAGNQNFFDAAEVASIDLTATPETWEAAMGIAEQELRRAIEHGFLESELKEQLANIRTGIENSVDRADTRDSTALASQLANSVNDMRVFTTPQSGLDRFNAYADGITVELVHKAFVEQWKGTEPLIHMSSNVEIEDAATKIIAAYNASKEIPVEAPEETSSAEFGYSDWGTPGEVVMDERIEDLDIRTIKFANNVRLNVKKTDFEEGVVRTSLRVGGGELEMADAPDGLNVLADNFYAAGGLGKHSADELQTLLAGKTVSGGFGVGADSFGAYGRTNADDLELQMQLWAAYLTDPGFRPEGEAQWKQAIAVFMPQLDATPAGIARRDVSRILANGDIRYGFGAEADLAARTYEELKPYLERAATEGAIEIAIVGDVEEDAAIAAVASTFGALPERLAEALPFDEARDVTFSDTPKSVDLKHAGLEKQAMAMTYWKADDGFDHKVSATQSLLRAVLRLKLTDKLREELGATYSPRAGNTASEVFPGYGYISASSEVEPQDIERTQAAIEEIAAQMASGGISEDELQRARKPILEGMEEAEEDNGSWIGLIDEAQSLPGDLDRWRNDEAVYEAITVEELTTAAARYFTPENTLKISITSDKLAE